MDRSRLYVFALVLLTMATDITCAQSQSPTLPSITSVFPATGALATSFPVVVTGLNFQTVNSVSFTGSGIFGSIAAGTPTTLTINISIAATAVTGAISMALQGPAGISDPFPFTIAGGGAWSGVGMLNSGRYGHTATVLQNGKVLVVGGDTGRSAEIFDPITNTWSMAGSMLASRAFHTATLLPNGAVLITGGYGQYPDSGNCPTGGTEIYNPVTGTSTSAGYMTAPRANHTASLLSNGKVLVTGGISCTGRLQSAELYDPVTSTWSLTGAMSTDREQHAAAVLANGNVLVAGGLSSNSTGQIAEVYNPTTAVWSRVSPTNTSHDRTTATILRDGRVFIFGASQGEVYESRAGTWSSAGSSPVVVADGHAAALLSTGDVLIAGASDLASGTPNSQLYQPATGSWFSTANMAFSRSYTTATVLPTGKVLVAGGFGDTGTNTSAELFDSNAISYSQPLLTIVSPTTVNAGSGNTTVNVRGGNFFSNSVIQIGSTQIATSFVDSETLTATVPAQSITAPGKLNVAVLNPGFGMSNTATFTVIGNPIPTVTSISPSMLFAGSGTVDLYVRGMDFGTFSTVRVNGVDRTTKVVNSSQLIATLLATDLTLPGSVSVNVFNGPPYGGQSGAASLAVLSRTDSTDRFPFLISTAGAATLQTRGALSSPSVGYAVTQTDIGEEPPSGFLIYSYRQNGILVSETSVPASMPLTKGRMYVEITGQLNTGIAIANPTAQTASISYSFTDSSGKDFNQGSLTLPPGNQVASFLSEAPFNLSATRGTLSFTSSVPIGVVALRGLVNERGDFLITSLPVTDLLGQLSSDAAIIADFADGGGWTTHVLLVNPTEQAISGVVQFNSQGTGTPGPASVISVNGQSGNLFSYTIAPKSSAALNTDSSSSSVNVGWIRVSTLNGGVTPTVLGVFSYKKDGITNAEAGVSSIKPGTSFRVYVESSGDLGASDSVQSGVALANPNAGPLVVTCDLLTLTGASTGKHGVITIPGQGQVALFLSQIPGLSPTGTIQAVLRMSVNFAAPPFVAMGLRGRYNERGDFLITATPPVNESSPPPASDPLFAQVVDGGGYTSQFVLLSNVNGGAGPGNTNVIVSLFSQSGQQLILSLN